MTIAFFYSCITCKESRKFFLINCAEYVGRNCFAAEVAFADVKTDEFCVIIVFCYFYDSFTKKESWENDNIVSVLISGIDRSNAVCC